VVVADAGVRKGGVVGVLVRLVDMTVGLEGEERGGEGREGEREGKVSAGREGSWGYW